MNNEKRLLLAITLSLIVVTGWSFVTSKLYPQKNEVVKQETPVTQAAKPQEQPAITEWPESSQQNMSLPGQDLQFSLPYAVLNKAIFKEYQNSSFTLTNGFLLPDKKLQFRATQIGQKISFTYEDTQKRIIKEFSPSNNKYNMGLTIIVENLGSGALTFDYPLVIGEIGIQNGHFSERLKEVFFAEPDKIVRPSPFKNHDTGKEIKFAGFRDRYFCVIVQPGQSGFKGYIKKLGNNLSEVGLNYKVQVLPGQSQRLDFNIYIGPQKTQLIEASGQEWGGVIYYGFFDSIAKGILYGLRIMNKVVGNWGLTLILLSIVIYFILYPLSIKQMRSMKKMQEIQPKVEGLRAKYKNDPTELNKKVLELYQKEKVNPFGGCLPMLLQIPIFFALYQGLIRSLELKGAGFLWIKDLAEPDKLISFAKPIPLVGSDINILPIAMAALMFFQQKLTMASSGANSSAAEQQKMMMYIMPVLFGFIFYNMPSGLVLYWFTNSVLMLVFQLRMAKQTSREQDIIDV